MNHSAKRTMFLLFLPLFIHLASASLLREHFATKVNLSINPCDDFFLHACSQSTPDAESRSKMYVDITERFKNISESRNLAIINDIETLKDAIAYKDKFNRTTFENLLQEKCGDDDTCYQDEFTHYYTYYDQVLAFYKKESNERLAYYDSRIDKYSGEDILKTLSTLLESLHDVLDYENEDILTKLEFYQRLINRLFVMEELKSAGHFESVANLEEDVDQLKQLIIEKFKNTPWMNEKDDFGLSLLPEFEDTISEMQIFYDFDENDRDLDSLRSMNSNFSRSYYKSRERETGTELLDIFISLYEARASLDKSEYVEEKVLVERVESAFEPNAFYDRDKNAVIVLAPYLYPDPTDSSIFDKNYFLYNTIAHEIFHSVVVEKWANRSASFQTGMNCLIDHYNRSCDLFGELQGECNSGKQTFHEDGPDVEGIRINYEFLKQNYNEDELREEVFTSEALSINREQAFFYLTPFEFCSIITRDNHTDPHSFSRVRVNGAITLMPEFARAFSCLPDRAMYSEQEHTCKLFGPDSK